MPHALKAEYRLEFRLKPVLLTLRREVGHHAERDEYFRLQKRRQVTALQRPKANSNTSVPGSGTGVIEGEAASGWSSRELIAPVSDPAPVGPALNAEASPMVKLEPAASASLFVRTNVPDSTNVPPA